MTDSAALQRKITGAADLRGIVRTMKALAAANITQYEKSVSSLADYVRAVEVGLGACLRQGTSRSMMPRPDPGCALDAVIFGSDQGLVGSFNDSLVEHAIAALTGFAGEVRVWAVGERVGAALENAGLMIAGAFAVPGSIRGISELVGRILLRTEGARRQGTDAALYVFHNRPAGAVGYEPVGQRLLPLDDLWRRERMAHVWPRHRQPQILGAGTSMLRALIGEYLFISLYRAGAESLASEQASRLAAMQRAERNIEDLLGILGSAFHRLRQSSIDEELFDVMAGFEALQPRAGNGAGRSLRLRG